jgi:hypothetical protein
MGAWVSYAGLGSENRNLPAFVVLDFLSRTPTGGICVKFSFWGSGLMPSKYQGVKFPRRR